MYGAIIGDMIGQPYEFIWIKTTDFDFQPCCFTDDTVMTLAVADALMNCGKQYDIDIIKSNLIKSMQYFGRKFDNAGYGTAFIHGYLKENQSHITAMETVQQCEFRLFHIFIQKIYNTRLRWQKSQQRFLITILKG